MPAEVIMRSSPRRGIIGVLAGLACSPVLLSTLGNSLLALVLSALLGIVIAGAFRPAPRAS